MTAAEVLRRAKELMNNGGDHWTQGTLVEGGLDIQRYCALGGLNAAAALPQVYRDGSGPGAEYKDGLCVPLQDREDVSTDDVIARIEATFLLAEVIQGGTMISEEEGKRYQFIQDAEDAVIGFNDEIRSEDGYDDSGYVRRRERSAMYAELAEKLDEAAALADERGL